MPPDAPIRVLTGAEFEAVAARQPEYYRGRRGYMSVAATAAEALIERRGLRTALELGPHRRPLIVGADTMDRFAQDDLETDGRRMVHDARNRPWPFEDGAFDLFVALQVFEHLTGHQADVFLEVRRVAHHAVISLPIDWVMADPTNAHHQLTHETAMSWWAPVVPTRVEVGSPAPRKRLVYVFEDLVPAPAGG